MPYCCLNWGRVTHMCIGYPTIIGSDNGLSLGLCQTIICSNTGTFLFCPLRKNFSKILTKIPTFSFTKMRCKLSSAILSWLQCVDSLWPSYTVQWNRKGSTPVHVLVCCMTAPSHYLIQCWLITNGFLLHSPTTNFTGRAPEIIHKMSLKITFVRLLPHLSATNVFRIFLCF